LKSTTRKEIAMEWVKNGSLHSSGYGAPELKQCYQPYMSGSLVISILLQVLCVAAYYVFRQPEVKSKGVGQKDTITISQFSFLPPLSALLNTATNSGSARYFRDLRKAIPVPAPIPLTDSSNTIPTQTEFTGVFGDLDGKPGLSDGAFTPDIGGNAEVEPPHIFQPVEKPPQVVKRVDPRYPETAVRACIGGMVYLNLWVDRVGKVRKAEVMRSDNPLFDSAAVRAGTQWIFTPAIMNNKPVSVWVTVPFQFRIEGHTP
jgi:TonB family protein